MDHGFDQEFLSDDELEEALDVLIAEQKDALIKEELQTTALNPFRLHQLQFVFAALKYATAGQEVQVSYKLYEPFKTMGSVSVEGKSVKFSNPEWFTRISGFASNIEVYPLSKNKIRVTFTFHSLTMPVS